MDTLNNIIQDWQTLSASSDLLNKDFITIKNKSVMDTIINFENQEKKDKQVQIFSALALVAFAIFILLSIDLTMMHMIGFAIIVFALALGIIANKTDDFPDARTSSVNDYLNATKENISSRKTRHIRMTFFVGLIYLPGVYLLFNDYFSSQLGMWWIPIALASGIFTFRSWLLKYNKRMNTLNAEVNELLVQLN